HGLHPGPVGLKKGAVGGHECGNLPRSKKRALGAIPGEREVNPEAERRMRPGELDGSPSARHGWHDGRAGDNASLDAFDGRVDGVLVKSKVVGIDDDAHAFYP